MTINKKFGKLTKGLISILVIALSLIVLAPKVSANESDAAAWVFIQEQLVDVDEDGDKEHFGARYTVMKDGSVIGGAIVRDGETTTQYMLEPGKISCDNMGRRFVQLDTQVIVKNGRNEIKSIGEMTTTFGLGTDDGYVIWENMSSGFNVKGQMITLTNPCPTPMPWLTWII